jgi:hypothetical protein
MRSSNWTTWRRWPPPEADEEIRPIRLTSEPGRPYLSQEHIMNDFGASRMTRLREDDDARANCTFGKRAVRQAPLFVFFPRLRGKWRAKRVDGAFVSCARPAPRARKERERRSSKFPVIPCYEGNIERGPNKLGRSERSFFHGKNRRITGGLTGKRTGRLLPVMMEERRGFPGNFEWKTGTKNFHTKRSNESWSALGRFVLVLYRGYLSVRK